MISIHSKKGFDLKITGAPLPETTGRVTPDRVALLPEKIPFVKPRLKIREGDRVKIGSVIFEDKRNPAIRFMSPGGGKVVEIAYGPRRVIKKVVIQLDQEEARASFGSYTDSQVAAMERGSLVEAILKGGLWCLFRQFPFGDIPDPEFEPPAIIVALDSREPFQPLPAVYLQGREDLLSLGVEVLKKLSACVHVSIHADSDWPAGLSQDLVTHRMRGPYPAGDAGVLLYRTKAQPEENRAWHISGQNLLLLAELVKTGTYPVERTVTLGGSLAREQVHVETRMGVPLAVIAGETNGGAPPRSRYIVGGIFRGYTAEKDSFLDLYATSLAILPEGDEKELFGFARPGLDKPTHSRTFLSSLKRAPFAVDCGLHGELRACINCGYCDDVCAVDILPQFALKSTLAGEVEESLAHGLLDCVSCGLCTYVCPSKIDVCALLKGARDDYYKEIS